MPDTVLGAGTRNISLHVYPGISYGLLKKTVMKTDEQKLLLMRK